MIDWMLAFIWRFAVVALFLWCIVAAGLGIMAATAVVYHMFDPGCPTVICT